MAIKEKLLTQARNDDEKIIIGRAIDLVEQVKKHDSAQDTSFLSPSGQLLMETVIKSIGGVRWHLDGGFEAAERKKIQVWPAEWDWFEPKIELSIIEIKPLAAEEIDHRDYLGALLGLGLKRDVLGDIVIHGDRTFVIVDNKIAEFILNNLQKIGSIYVDVQLSDLTSVQAPEPKYEVMTLTLVSLRLDSVIAKAFQLSRGVAANFIKQGRVQVDHRQQTSPAAAVDEGSLISCRGRGRCVILKNCGKTKKGKVKIEVGFPI